MMRTRLSCCLPLCVVLFVFTSAAGAVPDDDVDSAANAETVNRRTITVLSDRDSGFLAQESTVGSKFPTPARDVPQQLTVITQELMTTRADTSLYDALDNVPGIVLTPSADTATGNNINLRGFPAR